MKRDPLIVSSDAPPPVAALAESGDPSPPLSGDAYPPGVSLLAAHAPPLLILASLDWDSDQVMLSRSVWRDVIFLLRKRRRCCFHFPCTGTSRRPWRPELPPGPRMLQRGGDVPPHRFRSAVILWTDRVVIVRRVPLSPLAEAVASTATEDAARGRWGGYVHSYCADRRRSSLRRL